MRQELRGGTLTRVRLPMRLFFMGELLHQNDVLHQNDKFQVVVENVKKNGNLGKPENRGENIRNLGKPENRRGNIRNLGNGIVKYNIYIYGQYAKCYC